MTVRKIKNSWWVDFRHDHVRHRKKSPENSKAGAQAYEALLRQKLARGASLDFVKTNEKQKAREQAFKEFAWKWFDIYVRNNNKLSEVNNKKCTLKNHLVPFFGNTKMDSITTLQIEQYKSRKVKEGFANKSINCQLEVLSSCLHTARDWLEFDTIPKIKKLKEPPIKTVFLSHKECDVLLANSSGLCHEIVFMALKTGLRQGELKALQWSDINWHNKTLTVRHSWCEHEKGLSTPKSNKERTIPLTDELYKRLLQRKQAVGFVFGDNKRPGLNRKKVNQAIRNICKKNGLKEITCHILRHTFASHLAMASAPLKAIQELLGHSKIETTMRYTHISPSTLRETVGLLEPVKGITTPFGQYMGNAEQQQVGQDINSLSRLPQ